MVKKTQAIEANVIKKEEIVEGDKKNSIFLKLFGKTINTTNITNNNNYSPELIIDLNKIEGRIKDMEKLCEANSEKIKTLSHINDLYEFVQTVVISDSEIWKFWENNQVLEKMIDTQEERERRKIINNVRFLIESNHEEKTALFWMFLVSNLALLNKIIIDLLHLDKEMINKIRNVFPLRKTYVDFNDSCALFNKFGIFEQRTMRDVLFTKDNYNKIKNEGSMDIEKIYDLLPEINNMYNPDEKTSGIKGIQFIYLIPNIKYLSLAFDLMWKNLFPNWKKQN